MMLSMLYIVCVSTENGNPELPKKKTKLSQRPLKRWLQFSVEIGPYGNGTAQRYILWTSELPRGKRDRFIAVVQRVNRPGHLGDHVHNPVLFQKIVRLPDTQDSEYKAKWAYQQAKKALWILCKQVLEQATRPQLRLSYGEAGEWKSYEPGFATDTLGVWRQQTLHQLSSLLGYGEAA